MRSNRLFSKAEVSPPAGYGNPPPSANISVPTLDGGMDTKTDPADLEPNQFTVAQNVYIRNKRIGRRVGTSALTPTKPNSEAVSKMYTAKQYDGTIIQLRFSTTSIYRRGLVSWTEVVDGGVPITAPANNVLSSDNRHFMSNNGVNIIQELDLAANTYGPLGNAPAYKYITSFYNRIVGANLQTAGNEIPIQVGWSGDFNFDEWNPATDPSAGFAPLEESQSDFADAITSINGFADKMVITREQSIWLATKTPGQNPFYFYTAVPGIGCDVPGSVQKIHGGIAFYDRRTNSVYAFFVQEGLQIIGRPIEDSIYASIADPEEVFSGFDPIELEYKICTPLQGTTTVRCWTYSFKSNCWWYDDYTSITSVDTVIFEDASVLIQDLTGNIEDLIGNIEDLGPDNVPTPSLWFGNNVGDILLQDVSVVDGYETIIASKTWTAESDLNFYIQRLVFTYAVLATGSFVIQYSKDNQLNWVTHKTVSFTTADLGKRMRVTCAKPIYTRQFNWRIVMDTGLCEFVDFKATVEPGGYSK